MPYDILHAYCNYLYYACERSYVTLNMVYGVCNKVITQGLSP